MVSNMSNLQSLDQQNDLLMEQNKLLREQNELFRRSILDDDREVFVENINRDEIRNGFLVTSHRKKLWNAQIKLINEFARICKKHNLRWFATYGTLLGAVRHGGFIPWDDDVDVSMFRPEYEKFKSIVEDELKGQSNYKMWYWFNYRLESDTEAAKLTEPDLPLISKEQANKYPWHAPLYPMIRLVDTRTTYMMPDTRKNVFYSIWLDIFCLDPCPPFSDDKLLQNFQAARELLWATVWPEQTKMALESGKKFLVRSKELLTFLKLPYKKRGEQFDLFLAQNFVKTPYVTEMKFPTLTNRDIIYKTEDFSDIVYLPFEKIKVPAPVGYDSHLADYYGDWRKMKITHTHANEWSTDVPYDEYHKKSLRFAQDK